MATFHSCQTTLAHGPPNYESQSSGDSETLQPDPPHDLAFFVSFKKLPGELRSQIWRRAGGDGRVLRVRIDPESLLLQPTDDLKCLACRPAVLLTCREARAEVLKVLTADLDIGTGKLYFNPDADLVCITGWTSTAGNLDNPYYPLHAVGDKALANHHQSTPHNNLAWTEQIRHLGVEFPHTFFNPHSRHRLRIKKVRHAVTWFLAAFPRLEGVRALITVPPKTRSSTDYMWEAKLVQYLPKETLHEIGALEERQWLPIPVDQHTLQSMLKNTGPNGTEANWEQLMNWKYSMKWFEGWMGVDDLLVPLSHSLSRLGLGEDAAQRVYKSQRELWLYIPDVWDADKTFT
jgi:hypothetical protein